MEKDFNNLGVWLIGRIKAQNLGITEFAEKAKITRAALYYFINDKRRPDEESIKKICKALSVPVEEGKAQYSPNKKGRPEGRKKKLNEGVEQPPVVATEADSQEEAKR